MQQRRRLPLWIPLILLISIFGLAVFLLVKPMPAPQAPVEKPLEGSKLLEGAAHE